MPPYVSSYVVTPVAHRGSCNFAPAPLRPYSKVVQNLRYCLMCFAGTHTVVQKALYCTNRAAPQSGPRVTGNGAATLRNGLENGKDNVVLQ